MKITLIAVGNGGYNIANNVIEAGIISPAHSLVCDTARHGSRVMTHHLFGNKFIDMEEWGKTFNEII